MIKLATGYIPSFLGRLNIADDVELIELGYGSSKSIFRSPKKGIQDYTGDYSCHFGRSPITEEKSIQKKFINKLALDHELVDNFISIFPRKKERLI